MVRKFTNYFNNIYKETRPDEPSTPDLIKSNPLLKFTSVLSGRQLFLRTATMKFYWSQPSVPPILESMRLQHIRLF